jgi:hypothetical protein
VQRSDDGMNAHSIYKGELAFKVGTSWAIEKAIPWGEILLTRCGKLCSSGYASHLPLLTC